MKQRGRAIRIRKYEAAEYQQAALRSLMPPDDLSVSEWAEKYRILDSKTSALPGPWRNDKTPYLIGIMDEFLNYETEEMAICKGTQFGMTEAIQNMIGYIIQLDPSPTLVVYPSETLAESVSQNRLYPMITASPSLKERYHFLESSRLELQFDGMYLSLVGSNSASNLSSKAIRFLFLDEVDKYPGASKKESDPISLARERTKTFHNRKIVMTSTPTLKTGHIWKALEECDIIKHYFVPCPHCGEYIELVWAQIKFPGKDDEGGLNYAERAERAVYVCQKCGGIITDRHKPRMLREGQWRTVTENTKLVQKVGFWINTLYSPFVRFSEMVREWLKSYKDPEALQNFVNSWLAEPWEDTRLKTSADLVLERQTDIPELIVPSWAKMLTAGVDIQENCIYWTIRAWGSFVTSQNICHGQAFDLSSLDRIMSLPYTRQDGGEPMLVSLALIDSGYNADAVYDFCALHSDWALPCKGSSNPMQSHFHIGKVNKADSRAYGMNLVIIDSGKYKDAIAARMRKPNGTASWMVYQGCDREYAEQVTAEHKVNVRSGNKIREEWVKKTTHADNHYLDCEVYAMAAADTLQVRFLYLEDLETEQIQQPQQSEKQYMPEESWINENEISLWSERREW